MFQAFLFNKTTLFLFVIFILALVLRFLYFPGNTYFAYDAARDLYTSLEILKGDLKIVGPPTSASQDIRHGVFYYYLIAPILFLFNQNPEAVSAFLRIINALGVIPVYFLGGIIFSPLVGIIAAFLYAISYEQTQLALTYGHPSPAVLTVLLFYLGLAILIFKKKNWGFILALLGLGLSLQLEAVFGLLFIVFLATVFVFVKSFRDIDRHNLLLGIAVFMLAISTYLISEFKFGFRSTRAIFAILNSGTSEQSSPGHVFYVVNRLIHDNFVSDWVIATLFIIVIFAFGAIFCKRGYSKKILFLSFWFLGGILPTVLSPRFSYYHSAGATVSLLILFSFILTKINKLFLPLLLGTVLISNTMLIGENINGPNSDVIIQPEMITFHQKRAIDYIYHKAAGEPFAINGITIPLNINTTWSYLFFWYGRERYGYLPVWGAENAQGFYGNLEVETDRSKLPDKKFFIKEPTVGINDYVIDNIKKEENYFSKVVEEKIFGTIIVEYRQRI